MSGAEVAVAVVSYNTRRLLRRCIESLRADAEAGIATVWVVDNASADGSAEMAAEEFPWARLLTPGENLGFGRAVNLVAERSGEPWIAAANADVELRSGALAALLEAARTGERTGAIAPRLLTPAGETQHSVHSFPGLGLGLVFNLGLARLVPGLGDRLCLEHHWNPDRARAVDWAHGALLLVRRRAFEQAGGFDPEQWMYAEDLDLCWRLRRAGWEVRYEPAALAGHEVGAAAREAFAAERDSRHVAAAYRWMARRRGVARTWAYAALNAGGAGVRALALTPAAAIRPRRFGPRRARSLRFMRLHRLGLRRPAALREQR